MEYQLIYSLRKTLAMEVRGTKVIVRAPKDCPQKKIDEFVAGHEDWLRNKIAKNIPERVALFAKIIGVTYGRVTIRCQRTLWGSCSGKGNLNFNCLLMLAPPEAIDAIVVHELCHRKEMNHSKRFYAEVYKAFPEYDKWRKWLKDNGGTIMSLAR